MPTRRDFLKNVGLGAAALTFPSTLEARSEARKRPNILFIMTDDHASQAIGCYGSRLNKTPNLDRLAAEGVRFDQSFCTNSICAPSRAVLLTGKYSHLNGQIHNGIKFDGSQQTFPKLLQAAGYETALFGKWHLRSDPTGFDTWCILPGQGNYYNPVFINRGERAVRTGYVTDLITDDCLRWLATRGQDKPFCALLHHKAPHRNWMPNLKHLSLYAEKDLPVPDTLFDDYATRSAAAREQAMSVAEDLYMAYDLKLDPGAPGEGESPRQQRDRRMWNNFFGRLNPGQQKLWKEAYDLRDQRFHEAGLAGRELVVWKYQQYIKDYLRCIASVDENVGRVLDYLESAGLAEDTIVVYTSDQGFYLGEHGWFDKRFMYEESLGMPLIVRYPREIAPHVNHDDLVLNLDFAPTFLDFARVAVPSDMQGCSLRNVLRGQAPEDWRRSIYYHYYEFPGTHSVKRHHGVRTSRHKLIHFYHDIDAWELYDLEQDPSELVNVYDDPRNTQVVQDLKAELERLRRRYGDLDDNRYMPQPKIEVRHKAQGCAVTMKNACSTKYPGSGPGTLTDGVRAPDRATGIPDYDLWQGFEGVDLEAVVDLGAVRPVKRIAAGFLQNQQDWIFLPEFAELAVSNDGEDFVVIAKITRKAALDEEGVFRRVFQQKFNGLQCRYIRVLAKSVGICPEWHVGAGRKAWLFADEIIVD